METQPERFLGQKTTRGAYSVIMCDGNFRFFSGTRLYVRGKTDVGLSLFGGPIGPFQRLRPQGVEGTYQLGQEVPQAPLVSVHVAGSLSWHPPL